MAWGQSGRRAGVAATNWKGKACIRNNRRQQQSTHVFIFMPVFLVPMSLVPVFLVPMFLVPMFLMTVFLVPVLIPELRKLDPQLND